MHNMADTLFFSNEFVFMNRLLALYRYFSTQIRLPGTNTQSEPPIDAQAVLSNSRMDSIINFIYVSFSRIGYRASESLKLALVH